VTSFLPSFKALDQRTTITVQNIMPKRRAKTKKRPQTPKPPTEGDAVEKNPEPEKRVEAKAAAAPPLPPLPTKDVTDMSVSELRTFITTAGLSHSDCLEKSDLEKRFYEAKEKIEKERKRAEIIAKLAVARAEQEKAAAKAAAKAAKADEAEKKEKLAEMMFGETADSTIKKVVQEKEKRGDKTMAFRKQGEYGARKFIKP
jgi:hypothetical protein